MHIYRLLKDKTKLSRKRSLHRFKILLKYYGQKTEKIPVFILTTRRTGSNLLLDYLNSVPGVSFAPEILNKSMFYGIPGRGISKPEIFRHIRHSINACAHSVCGAKLVGVQMKAHNLSPEDLHKLYPQARFILLYRKSLVEQFVSLKIAEMTNTWQWSRDFKPPTSLHVSLSDLREHCRSIRSFYEKMLQKRWLTQHCLLLSYEDLTEDAQTVFNDSVFPFLRLPATVVRSTMVKQNTRKLRALIENYEEIRRFMNDPLARQEHSLETAPVRERLTYAA